MVAMVQEQHPALARLAALESALSALSPRDLDGMDPESVRGVMGRLAKVSSRISALQLAGTRVLESANIARKHGATSTGDLLGRDLGNDLHAGNQLLRTAAVVAPQSKTETALASGDLSMRQAQIIGKGLAQLPETVTPEQRERAEARLIRDAKVYRPKHLQRRADRITDQFLSKDEVDRTENDLLVAREKAAREKTRLDLRDNRDGTHSGSFTIPDLAAAQLKAALQALSAPRRDHLREAKPTDFPHRMGMAFIDLLNLMPTGELPVHGGVSATVTVNIDLESLKNRLSVVPGTLTDGTRISVGEVRRLACDGGIIPQVLGGKSVPLDMGQERRFFSKHQRLALAHRDRGCSFPVWSRRTRGVAATEERPPGWCETHHVRDRWSDGGTTDLADGALLCSHHHHTVHSEHWDYRLHARDGIPEYKQSGSDIWQRNHRWRT